jgi:MFS family permease
MVAGLFGMFFLGSLYMERVLGYGAIDIGLAFLPVSLGIGILSLGFSARLGMRFGQRPVLLVGLVGIAAGLLLFSAVPVDGDYVSDMLPAMLLFGVGAGLAFPALMTLAMSNATPDEAGLLSGLVNTTQQVGGALGLAVLATFATSRTDGLLEDGTSTASALTSGYTLAFGIGAGFVLAAIVIAVAVLRPAPATESEPVIEPAYSDAA